MELGRSELIFDALARQDEERLTGFAIHNEPLRQLMQLAADELIAIVSVLLDGESAERELGARLLGSDGLSGDVVRASVDAVSRSETDPEVVRWLVEALGNTRDPASLPRLAPFAAHQDAQVRFMVPDAIDACALNFPQVAETLFLLAEDLDRDVRWSAVFELAAWLGEEDEDGRLTEDDRPEIEGRLRRLLVEEPDEEIRELIQTALAKT